MSILNYFKINSSNHNNDISIEQNSTIYNQTENKIEKKVENQNDYINIYTDGACINNGKKNAKAGIGIYISDNFTISEKLNGVPTNQRAELYAILKSLLIIDIIQYKNIYIYTDSMYSINCITKWVKNWKKNGWKDSKKKDIKNKDLINNIDKIYSKYNHIYFKHILAHTSNKDIHSICNNKADKLAKNSIL
tara:strand:- start:96 stop:671 length:576 start_codon:yes stop_codon:yes gene_type:complete